MSAFSALDDLAAGLRRSFDQSFAVAGAAGTEEVDDFLLVRVSDDPYALRIAEIGGISTAGPIVRAPSRRAELLGLAGIRGTVSCVYSMAVLLGLPRENTASVLWLALSRGADPLAFAFGRLEGFVRIPRSSLHDEGDGSTVPLVRGRLMTGSPVRPILDFASILETVRSQAGTPGPTRSRP